VGDRRASAGADQSTAAVAFEQRDADTALQFGESLRQRRRAHADALGGQGPGGLVGDRHEVLHLTDGQIGEWTHLAKNTVVMLHNDVHL
jgi:hypothetical protein